MFQSETDKKRPEDRIINIEFCYDSSAPITVEENIEPEKVGIVIGPKGSIIMDIMKKSGAKVVINQDFPKGQPHRIKYTGMKFFRNSFAPK